MEPFVKLKTLAACSFSYWNLQWHQIRARPGLKWMHLPVTGHINTLLVKACSNDLRCWKEMHCLERTVWRLIIHLLTKYLGCWWSLFLCSILCSIHSEYYVGKKIILFEIVRFVGLGLGVWVFDLVCVCDFHSIAQASALVKHVVLLIEALRMLHHKQLLSNISS